MIRLIERILWCVALVSLSAYGLVRTETWLYQLYADWEFTQMLTGGPIGYEYFARGLLGEETTSASLAKQTISRSTLALTSPAASVQPKDQPLGRLEIASINLSAIFLEGADDRTLRLGVGHIPGTALPGEPGNLGLSGHRDTFFDRLGEIRQGDLITIMTLKGRYDYAVESMQIVDPDEAIVLADIGRPVLTLVTCYPFQYVGPAPKRFVVHASLTTAH